MAKEWRVTYRVYICTYVCMYDGFSTLNLFYQSPSIILKK